MDVTVIPWFLVLTSFAAINNTEIRKDGGPAHEPEQNHGLVYVYNVSIDYSRSLERNVEDEYTLNLTSTLRCRLRNESVLFCALDERRTTISSIKHNGRIQSIQVSKEAFEIDYNRAGVESIRVSFSYSPRVVSDERYGLIKIIASQLNVGTDLGKRKSFAFTTNETSSFGECQTDFTVSTLTCTENETREDLRLRSIFHKSLGDTFLLRKRRNMRNCDRPNEVFFIENGEHVVSTVTSSYSEMRVCTDSFESLTIAEGKAIITNEDAHASVFRQTVKIRLENIERAEEDLPPFVADTGIDTIYLHKDVDSNEFDT